MRELITDLAVGFLADGGVVVDLGCSRGEALAALVERLGPGIAFVGIDASEAMLAAARDRFAAEIRDGRVSIQKLDLRDGYPPHIATVVLGILTLQFVPIEHRPRILADVYRHLRPGGAFLLVEKVLGANGRLDRLLTDRYRVLKSRNGYSAEDIDAKRKALEGALVPVTAAMNEAFLRGAGFRDVECVWRWCNFAGWIAVKE